MTLAELYALSTMTAEQALMVPPLTLDAAITCVRETSAPRVVVLVDGHYLHCPIEPHYLHEYRGCPMFPVAVPSQQAA